jgi:hypothetical protein
VYINAASATAKPAAQRRRSDPITYARAKAALAARPISTTSAYMRPSMPYWVRNGLVAASTAAVQPPRTPKTALPAQNPTGTASTAHVTENARTAASEVPNASIQKCSSM